MLYKVSPFLLLFFNIKTHCFVDMKYFLILILFLSFACTTTTKDVEEETMSETEVTEEMDNVDALLKRDKQRLDSMEQALKEQMENLEE